MSFALGFLVASLAALLMLPVLNRRAARLARRRIDGLFPMSMQEIAAERDALRAEFAVAERRLERKVETARAGRHGDMQAVGAKLLEVAALQRDVEGRDAALSARKAEMEEALARISGLDRDLSTSRTDGAASLAALTALEEAHRDILVDLKTTRRDRDAVREDLKGALSRGEVSRGPSTDGAADGTAALGSPPHELHARHDALVSERDTLAASLAAAEAALATALSGRHAKGSPQSSTDDADLRRRISEVADALVKRDRLPSTGSFPLTAVAES
ncbi:hypothetical protein GGR33_001946 [Methylobacterium brachythecii]|uniref:Uncharacterized protein n=2 Tax=Methylobacterium brachythecii TaxID=1176177 RepID=A0A7W6F6W3_9HYPH|nr:hypothetical protein [Methylobacterium brachythecii]MBB3902451.1 hypothetical protein [Methylobacterium brachythecii]GLS42299.1 hypothetical protein GCM10007884_02840 [Methylobacterium brachythecii]